MPRVSSMAFANQIPRRKSFRAQTKTRDDKIAQIGSPQMSARRYRIGVDVGGTFTDFVLIDIDSGELTREKCLTTPDDPVAGIMHGIERLLAGGTVTASQIHGVAHATTLVTNTLIERKGAPTGLLTTEGFRDSLELGSDMRYDMYDLAIEFPEPLVPRTWRLGINERVTADNKVLHSPKPCGDPAQGPRPDQGWRQFGRRLFSAQLPQSRARTAGGEAARQGVPANRSVDFFVKSRRKSANTNAP